MKKIQTFLNLSIAKKYIFFKAFFLSAYVRFVTKLLPMSWWYKNLLGEQVSDIQNISEHTFFNLENDRLKSIVQMVKLACRYAPWNSKCLVESILIKRLARNFIELPICLGLNKKSNVFSAHAWVGGYEKSKSIYNIVSVHI